MKLIRTNAVFSRIALVSCFCAEIQLSEKIPENIPNVLFSQETHGARRGGAEDPGVGQTWPRRGIGLAVLGPCLAASDFTSAPPFAYMMLMMGNLRGVQSFTRKKSAPLPPRETLFRGPDAPFWHPVGTGIWRRSSPSSSPTPLHQPLIHFKRIYNF